MNRYTQQKIKFIYTYHVYGTQHLLEEEKSSIRAPEDRYLDNRSGSGYPVECFRLLGASSYNENVCMEF
jgi:hypothetical protein